MATLQSGKCFTVPTFFGMCCRSEWQERMYIYKWHEVDQTKHEIFCVHIVCNEIQVKVNLEITTFFFLFAFSILSQLFLIWGCRCLYTWMLLQSPAYRDWFPECCYAVANMFGPKSLWLHLHYIVQVTQIQFFFFPPMCHRSDMITYKQENSQRPKKNLKPKNNKHFANANTTTNRTLSLITFCK